MRRYELKQFVYLYRQVNEIAKRIWLSKTHSSKDNYHGVLIKDGKIMAANDDGFYNYCDDITKEFIEEILPDDLIF